MKCRTNHGARVVPLALVALLMAGQSQAETPAQKKERLLLQRLAKSDAQAAALQARIDALEKRLDVLRAAVAASPAPVAARAMPASQVSRQAPQQAPQQVAQSAPQTPATTRSASTHRPGLGTFEVDEEAAQRALERTLTQTGALLLPTRTIEITPSFTYQRVEQTSPVLASITNPVNGTPALVLTSQRTRRNEMAAHLGVRAGLPHGSQLELDLPYNYVRSSQVTDLGPVSSANGSGVGDVSLGIAKTLVRESGWRPDLIGRLTYNFGNGRRQDGTLSLGSGFRQVQGELVALKRQDPLAFVASTFYSRAFEKDGIKPGDAAGFSLASVLAASPATSLQLGFAQIYRREQENNGLKVRGSDQTYGIASLGASSVLSRDVTLLTQFGIGVGGDAPKYSFSVSLPILFR
jgi:hypothetical protein